VTLPCAVSAPAAAYESLSLVLCAFLCSSEEAARVRHSNDRYTVFCDMQGKYTIFAETAHQEMQESFAKHALAANYNMMKQKLHVYLS
jgi:hypothetical protein